MSVFAVKPKHIPCDTIEELMVIADEREAWAKEAEEKDMHGSAAEWRLTAKLARRLIGEMP